MAEVHNWMTSREDRAARRPLDTQSRARALTQPEQDLATGLEAVFAKGIHDFTDVAQALAGAGVVAPISGGTDWDVDKLTTELMAINASLDCAYEESGYGA